MNKITYIQLYFNPHLKTKVGGCQHGHMCKKSSRMLIKMSRETHQSVWNSEFWIRKLINLKDHRHFCNVLTKHHIYQFPLSVWDCCSWSTWFNHDDFHAFYWRAQIWLGEKTSNCFCYSICMVKVVWVVTGPPSLVFAIENALSSWPNILFLMFYLVIQGGNIHRIFWRPFIFLLE